MKQAKYESPLGTMIMVGDRDCIHALFFEHQVHYYGHYNLGDIRVGSNRAIDRTKMWLDKYFNGENPDMDTKIVLAKSKYHIESRIYKAIMQIPYGEQWSYQHLLDTMAPSEQSNINLLNATKYFVQHNKLQILIPSHRIKDDNYPGGSDCKIALINLEQQN